MSPQNQNILDTLNLLVLLSNSVRYKLQKSSDLEQDILIVTNENLESAKISIPVFVNTLNLLQKKGYLLHSSVYEKEYHEKIREYATVEKEKEILQELQEKGLTELPNEAKLALTDMLEKMLPANSDIKIDRESILNEKLTFKEYLEDTRSLRANHKDTDISHVYLMPFRDITKLLEKMNSGKTFDEIQDSSIWYDSKQYKFHIGEEVISTIYQGKPNIEHYVLEKLTENYQDGAIWFSDIDTHKPRAFKDALNRWIKDNEKLKSIFTVYSNRLEFDKKLFE